VRDSGVHAFDDLEGEEIHDAENDESFEDYEGSDDDVDETGIIAESLGDAFENRSATFRKYKSRRTFCPSLFAPAPAPKK